MPQAGIAPGILLLPVTRSNCEDYSTDASAGTIEQSDFPILKATGSGLLE